MIQPDNEFTSSSNGRLPVRTPHLGAFLLLVGLFTLGSCAGPTEASPATITLRVSAPASVLVNNYAMLTVQAVNQRGAEVGLPQPLAWTSSDTTVAPVTSSGVVLGRRRGNAVITVRAGTTSAVVALSVRARVKIAPSSSALGDPLRLALAAGDTVPFMARYVDVNGVTLDETPSTTWASSDPAAVSVSASGLVVGVTTFAAAMITGSTADGPDSALVSVGGVIAGLPATIRFAHTVLGAGPVTFIPSKGAPVTLSFGESVQRPVLSGMFDVSIAWGPSGIGDPSSYHDRPTMIRPGDRLELYAIKTPTGLFVGGDMILAQAWGNTAAFPPGSALVRFLQSSPFLVFDVRPPGSPASGILRHCYFDPGDRTDYAPLLAGDFDLVLKHKFSSAEQARLRATAPAGRAVTYVIIGETGETAGILAFPDP